jgi:hypothetical protein
MQSLGEQIDGNGIYTAYWCPYCGAKQGRWGSQQCIIKPAHDQLQQENRALRAKVQILESALRSIDEHMMGPE